MPSHDEICDQAVDAVNSIDRDAVLSAFVGSLSTRNLPARSAFGSYVVLQHFTRHDFQVSQRFSMGWCAHCGLPAESEDLQSDDRVLKYPFQVQHTRIDYAAHDLSTFDRRAVNVPTSDDIRLLQRMFDGLRSLPASAQLSELGACFQGIFKSNQHERMILLETWGYAGILCPSDVPHYSQAFVAHDFAESHQPEQVYKREWEYPVRFWTGADGVNEAMVTRYFGAFL